MRAGVDKPGQGLLVDLLTSKVVIGVVWFLGVVILFNNNVLSFL